MGKTLLFTFCALLCSTAAFGAGESARFVEKLRFPGATAIAVVAEGEFEPRSIGSYTLRVYAGSSPEFPFDDFVAGLVRPRDGIVEAVKFHDFDGDGAAELVVVTRSAGSGGYLSADAFSYSGQMLTLLESVCGLAPAADPLAALAGKIR